MTTVAVAGALPRRRSRALLVGGVAGVLLIVVALFHLGQGASGIGLLDLLGALAGNGDTQARAVFEGSRLPRTLAGLVAGTGLGLAGALIQGSTRNPLAAPETLGVNAGAYLAVVAASVLGFSLGGFATNGIAFLGGLGAATLVRLLVGSGPLTPARVLLAGTAVSMAGMSGVSVLMILAEEYTQGLYFWGAGSLLQTGLSQPAQIGLLTAITALLTPLLARPLDLLALGDDTAEAMGVRAGRIRLFALLLGVLLAACAVTVAGPISFVGLIAPVIVRTFGIRRHASLLPLSALIASVMLLAADSLAQFVVTRGSGYFGELPVGVVTALLGAPIFILLARSVSTGDADTGAAVNVAYPRSPRVFASIAIGIAVVLAGLLLLGLRLGDLSISWGQVFAVLGGAGDAASQALVDYRLPRVLIAAGAGACLAIAGVAVQSVVRNPLAEPNLLGVTGGAATGAVLIITVLPWMPVWGIPAGAMIGGTLALLLVVALAVRSSHLDPTRVVLIGIGVSAVTTSLVNLMAIRAQMNLASALTWLAGSTYGRDLRHLGWLLIPALVGVLLLILARPLDLMALGDDLPRSLGLSLTRTRLLVLTGAALVASGTAAAVGTVGFVGLVAPHLARRLVGSGHRRLLVVAALLGASVVVIADMVGRWALAPREIPVGIVTALIGTPYLIWLLRRQGVSQ